MCIKLSLVSLFSFLYKVYLFIIMAIPEMYQAICVSVIHVNNLMHSNSILKCMHCLLRVKHEYIQYVSIHIICMFN